MGFGLLGRKLGHSYSPQIHKFFGSYDYKLYEREPDELKDFFESGDWNGINVTIPYKKDAYRYCSELSPQAEKLGAVNTVIRRKDGTLYGHNTDFFGFDSMLTRTGLDVYGKKVLILGSGGASVTAQAVIKEHGGIVVVVSREGENNYKNISKHQDAFLIVNATPVGMFPENGVSPVVLSDFPDLQGVLDMIYNPARTALLLEAEKMGLIAQNGLWMLIAQGKESAELFLNESISDTVISEIHNHLSHQMENIILIGMPGCGKSTIGKELAKILNRSFVDTDTEIEISANMSIPEIFNSIGEVGFRTLETSVLSQICKKSGAVIATGGGCVTRSENYPLLHQNGRIYYIQRNVTMLPIDGRPLSKTRNLQSMFTERHPLYEKFADATVENNGPLTYVLDKILTLEGYN